MIIKRKISLLVILVSLLSACTPLQVKMTDSPDKPVKVFFFGPDEATSSTGRSLKIALQVGVDSGALQWSADAESANVLVVNGSLDDPQTLRDEVQGGKGLLLVASSQLSSSDLSTLFATPLQITTTDAALSLTDAPGAKDSLNQEIYLE